MIFRFLFFLIGFILAGAHYSSYSAFIKAVQEGHVSKVETLLATANVAAYDNEAIRFASANGDVEIVRLLLAIPNVDPGARNNQAMLLAAKNGRTEIIRLLLTHPRVHPSINGRRAVFLASELNHADVVKLLIIDGRVQTVLEPYVLSFQLMKAAEFENVDLLRFLLSYSYYNRIGHLVFKNGDLRSIKTMVAAGYRIDQENLEKTLRDARASGKNDVVEYLEALKENFEFPSKPLISMTMTEQCAICLSDEDLLEGFMTTCNHQFHADCLREWIAEHNTCPICRSLI